MINKMFLFSFFQVDESVLSSENGDDLPIPPPPLSGSYQGSHHNQNPSYPWVQMALPGGGIVSVPLERASSGASSTKAEHDLSPTRGLVQPLQPTSSGMSSGLHSGGPGSIPAATSSATGSVGSVTQADLLTVAAGEPVTHFNLDQLLEIVQSFQLDTSMAGHDDEMALRTARDLVLCADLVSTYFKYQNIFFCFFDKHLTK